MDNIAFARPNIGPAEIDAVTAVLKSGWLTSGAKTRDFEQAFADAVGAEHAVALNSCTAALHLALIALGIGDGDEVIVPTMTFAATAEVVYAVGATPVLADSRPDDLTIDPKHVESLIGENTRAVIPMHYGTIPVLKGTPEEYKKALGNTKTRVIVLQPGEKVEF